MSVDLFAYGVLMLPELMRALVGREFPSRPAVLPDHQRYTVRKAGYAPVPATVPERGARVEGVLVAGVDPETLAILDDFEEIAAGVYRRVPVAILDGGVERSVQAYLAGPKLADCLGEIWDPVAFTPFHDRYRVQIIPRFLQQRRVLQRRPLDEQEPNP
ncbi:MAG: gamma-glutamylcyclotransferase family protein [Acidobacteriota bacterium]